MALALGHRIGPYDITGTLGAGGMGEVYRARDTKLGRDVAMKVLPDAFTRDPDRLARFQREAQVLASLNHPHIGAIYGFEDSGETHALVLELVEGDTLADRIARGAVPLDEAVPIAKQIAEALEAAHEQGIIHRDLKPANIKVTPDGMVKVLDFGLAKLDAPGMHERRMRTSTASPTITSPAMMTGVGMLLGTAAYMSPEQAKGRAADKRSDIWAFGCVLYEMLTGRRAFDGEDVTEVLGAVRPHRAGLGGTAGGRAPAGPHAAAALPGQGSPRASRRHLGSALRPRLPTASRSPSWHRCAAAHTDRLAPRPARWSPRWPRRIAAGAGVWFATRPASPSVVRTTITTSGSTALTLQTAIATSPSRPMVRASCIAAITSCWCVRSTSSSPRC